MSTPPATLEAGADLRHIDTWLFDLDNTLYPLESGLGEMVSTRITDFVTDLTGLPRAEAHALQKRYLVQYGLTLRGMATHHGVDPDVYHAMFHDLPLDVLSPDPALIVALERLPGRRLIFTNADDVHAARVMERLGVAGLFEDVFHIASSDFTPKPAPEAFERIVAAHQITPATTVFFDDAEHNLAPAAAMGMTTVLVGPSALNDAAPFVSHRACDLSAFLAGARLKGQP